jgi:predicted lipoprotein with Yx(FWY)xxD motif
MLITACAPGDTPNPVETVETPVTLSTATESIVETPTEAIATEIPTPAETATDPADASVTVMVNENEMPVPYLVDEQGRSLYVYMNDSQNGNTSSCLDDCAVEWPPLVVTGTPAAGPGVDATRLGTIKRDDGSSQATFNGWPLYYYTMDTAPGTTNGQSYTGVWFLVSPTGEPIQQ